MISKLKCIVMQKAEFTRLIQSPTNLSLRDKMDIQSERMRFPYCAPLQILDLVGDKVCGIAQWEMKTLPITSLYIRNRYKLNDLLLKARLVDDTPAPAPQVAAAGQELAQQAPVASAPAEQPMEDVDILQEINAYQEISFKTAPKSVILSKFLDIDVGEPQQLDETEQLPVEVLAKKSIANEGVLETETLALVFEKQGKYDKAVEVYKKLIVKYPEKSSTFATRIIELENIIENSKK